MIPSIIKVLQEELKGADEKDKFVVLSFDEMAIKRNMVYVRSGDHIDGYEDLGSFGVSHKPVNHALVSMVCTWSAAQMETVFGVFLVWRPNHGRN